jgi:trk system potassium uptake protein TrkA
MYIVIVGGGSVGYYLCKELLKAEHEVLVLDKDLAKCERFGDEFGSVCIRGDGCEVTTQANAGVARADVFIATTNEDEDNLIACQIAKHRFDVPRTIARVSNPKNEPLFKKLGIDCTIVVTDIILKHIEEGIPEHPLIHFLGMGDEETEIVEVKIGKDSRAVGKSVKELNIEWRSIFALLIRNGQKPQVPKPDTVFKVNDRIIAVSTPDYEDTIRSELIGTKQSS